MVARSQTFQHPTPTMQQLQWSKMEFYLFIHFGPNTFTDLEWGKGSEKEEVFNPAQLDCRQWCRIAKAAGAKGIIITAKHHDGFCLWPSNYSSHTVRESSWKEGKGDVLRELSDACKEYHLKMGVYLSPWDRNHPKYGTDEYNDVFINMMKEVVSRYGPFFEFWWDGANGEGPNGKKQVYQWNAFKDTMRAIAPLTVIFTDIGPGIRWAGNEKGTVNTTNWNTLDTAGFSPGAGAPPQDTLNTGNRYGKVWLPAECDVSIRPGWFYHAAEDTAVKTPDYLFSLYLKSVGRGANLLLNVPPDRRGLFTAYDSAALMGFKKLREENFEKDYFKKAAVVLQNGKTSQKKAQLTDGSDDTYIVLNKTNTIQLQLPEPVSVNCVVLKEAIQTGQYVSQFHISIFDERNIIIKQVSGTTIGAKRILTFPSVITKKISIVIDKSDAPASLCEAEAYKIDDSLTEQ